MIAVSETTRAARYGGAMQPVIVREIRRVSLAPAPGAEPIADRIAVEEPLEIRVNGKPLAVTLRTPGDDEALAAGFLHAEGFVSSPDDIAAIRRRAGNVIEVRLAGGRRRGPAIRPRRFPVTGACGVCGKSGIEQLRFAAPPIVSSLAVAATVLRDAAAGLRDAQPLFRLTGGLHGAGVFAADGTLRVLKEDVGRHNAVDKAVGALFLERALPLDDALLVVSGRAGFEIVQKAVRAGIPVLCAVSAPTSLAVETAHAFGLTLAGFLRGESMNVYTHPGRIVA